MTKFFCRFPWVRDVILGVIVVVGLILVVSIMSNTTKVTDVRSSLSTIDTVLQAAVSRSAQERLSNFQIEKDLLERIAAKQDTLMAQQDSLIKLLREGLE